MTIFVNIVLAIIVALALWFFLSRRLLESLRWRATVTPLASIIGSGFLVSVPLLSNAVGNAAIFAMAALVLYAFWVGGAIRFNIRYGEQIFEAHAMRPSDRLVFATEQMSQIALACAYFISVSYYLSLLSVFLMKGLGQSDPWTERALTTGFLIFIGSFGFIRGLKGLERLEEYAVGFKLAVIVAILVALAGHNVSLFMQGEWALQTLPAHFDTKTFRALLGFVIVVQGFETSRFLAGEYPTEQRVRTMRDAQILSGGIYLVFFALATVMFKAHFADGEVAAIVDMVGVVAIILPLLLTAAAIASQFSASVADAIGGAGLMHQALRRRLPLQMFYPFLAGIAVLIVWTGSVFDIIALASRAFAFYYALQCFVAVLVAFAKKGLPRRTLRATWFVLLALLSLGAALYGIPASA